MTTKPTRNDRRQALRAVRNGATEAAVRFEVGNARRLNHAALGWYLDGFWERGDEVRASALATLGYARALRDALAKA